MFSLPFDSNLCESLVMQGSSPYLRLRSSSLLFRTYGADGWEMNAFLKSVRAVNWEKENSEILS